MIDQIIAYILSPLMGDCYKARGIKPYPLVPKDIVVRGFIIDSETMRDIIVLVAVLTIPSDFTWSSTRMVTIS